MLPHNATDKEWKKWLSSSCESSLIHNFKPILPLLIKLDTDNPNYHPVGTAAMMAKELGGVLDENLRVYGTKNVRVIDASVLPFQISGHLTSTLYAVTERLVDIMKSD